MAEMQEIAQLLIMLGAYYATFGIMAIGFGMMLRGTEGAAAAGEFFFVRPVRATFEWLRTMLVALVGGAWTRVLKVVGSWIVSEIKEIPKDIRWLVTRERGWVRRR